MLTVDVDVTSPDLYRTGFPHELFDELRSQGSVLHHPAVPMHRSADGIEFWMVIRHEEIVEANRDWQRFSALLGPSILGTDPSEEGNMLISSDPPVHTRLRKVISAGFTPRMIGRLDEQIEQWARRILDDAAARGECDFVHDVAYPLPMHVIADIVGIPDVDRPWVFEQTDVVMRAGDPTSAVTRSDHADALRQLFGYAQELGREKRARPTDDVWSILANAELDDGDGTLERLSELELDLFFLLLSAAGSETTRNTISSGLLALLEHPAQLASEYARIPPCSTPRPRSCSAGRARSRGSDGPRTSTPSSAARRSGGVIASHSGTRPAIGMSGRSTIRTASTSAARRTTTSRSAVAASTSASARISRAPRDPDHVP